MIPNRRQGDIAAIPKERSVDCANTTLVGIGPRGPGRRLGDCIMMATITFFFFLVALALPGLIGELMGGTADNAAEAREGFTGYTPGAVTTAAPWRSGPS